MIDCRIVRHTFDRPRNLPHCIFVGVASISQGVIDFREGEAAVCGVLHRLDDVAFRIKQFEAEHTGFQSFTG